VSGCCYGVAYAVTRSSWPASTRGRNCSGRSSRPSSRAPPDGRVCRARFAQSIRVLEVPDDVDGAVRVRLQRQEILYRPDKRFHFLLTEAVLRYRLCPVEVMLAQLDRLVALSAMRNVRLGVIPFEAPYAVAPAHGFWLLDEDLVIVETFSAELNLAQPPEIALYSTIFDRLAAIASYGRDARAVITRVIEELSSAVAGDGDLS
jgi:hypothetical protein